MSGITEVDLGDGRHLTINISHEGIVMDVYNYIDGWEDSPDMGLEGTVGMMFDEWADWIVVDDIAILDGVTTGQLRAELGVSA